MWVSDPARALAHTIVLAFTPLIFSQAFAAPIESAPALRTPSLSPARVGPEAAGDPGPVRLAAIDPRTTDSSPSHSAGDGPFGLIRLRAPEGQLWRKWRRVQQEIRDESEVLALCRASPLQCSSEPARRFLAIIETAQARQGRARLGEINRAINLAIRPMSDLVQYGVVDLWTSPLATLAAGAGDCEDYAIAKYVALREAGIDSEDLRLLLVRDTRLREDHAVVAARLDGRWVVLDNRRLILLEDIQLQQYVPMFEIDDDGVKRLVSGDEPNEMLAAFDAVPAVH
jgi:predicted transglutaminase-like cysteine proteinase